MRQGLVWAWMVVALSIAGLARVSGTERPAGVPFDLVQQHLIVVKGSVGGVSNLNLLIDTGAIPSVIDRRIARKLHVIASPSRLVAFGQSASVSTSTPLRLQIGSRDVGEVAASIGDLSYLDGMRIDAIVGLDVLARSSFQVDYQSRRLSFAPDGSLSAVVPLEIVWPFIAVRLSVAGHLMRLLVDTGSRDVVLFKSRLPAEFLPLPWKGDKVIRHAAGSERLLRFERGPATLGGERWDKLPTYVLDASTEGYPPGIDGVLGVLALGAGRVRFDFERGELAWSR
jgi:hypothetical protein